MIFLAYSAAPFTVGDMTGHHILVSYQWQD
jgi:hypothetical protein